MTHVPLVASSVTRVLTTLAVVCLLASPDNFAPQFGGYCTRAMSKKITIAASPKVWRIYNDKLYVFFAPIGLTKFNEAPDPMIAQAQAFRETLVRTE